MTPEVRKQALLVVATAYRAAWADAEAHARAALEALTTHDVLASHDARTEFQDKATAALSAAQTWVNATNGCLDVIDELEHGLVKPRL